MTETQTADGTEESQNEPAIPRPPEDAPEWATHLWEQNQALEQKVEELEEQNQALEEQVEEEKKLLANAVSVLREQVRELGGDPNV